MSLSVIFLMIFLIQHLSINLTSLIPDGGKTFNAISHFMGYNPIVQFVLQPILIFGVFFHFIMGLVLEYENRAARKQKYVYSNTRSSWISRNMIITGLVILSFLILHFYDFWIPEIQYKYLDQNVPIILNTFMNYKKNFMDNIAAIIYCVSFILFTRT